MGEVRPFGNGVIAACRVRAMALMWMLVVSKIVAVLAAIRRVRKSD